MGMHGDRKNKHTTTASFSKLGRSVELNTHAHTEAQRSAHELELKESYKDQKERVTDHSISQLMSIGKALERLRQGSCMTFCRSDNCGKAREP